MNRKLGTLATLSILVALMTAFHSVAIANPAGHCDNAQMSPEKIQEQIKEHMKARLDRLAGRLEIKASQQAAWEEFSKSVAMLAERHVKAPADDADAATISRYRADRAAEFAKKQAAVADATAKLQAALTEAQRKILTQESRRFLRRGHGWRHMSGGRDHEGHEWNQRGSSGGEKAATTITKTAGGEA